MSRWFAVPVAASTENGGVVSDGGPYPLSAYGLLSASGLPEAFTVASSFDSGVTFASRVRVLAGVEISSLWVAVRTAGVYTSGTPNQLGLYDDAGVQLGVTADDATLWAVSGWRGGELVGGPVPSAAEERYVYILILAKGFSGISIPYAPAGSHQDWFTRGPAGGNQRAMYSSAGSLPASFDPASYGTATSFLPMVGIS